MKQFTVTGSNFDCGYQLGKKFRKEIRWRLRHTEITPVTIARHWQQVHRMYHYCQQHYPSFLQEIAGMAEGAGADFLELFFLNCPELSQYHHGCSSIAVVDKKKALLAHNEDGDAFERQDKCALITYQLSHKLFQTTFHSFVYLGELPGSAYTWNASGLFFTVNYVPVKKLNFSGAPYYFITRQLAEARSIAGAVKILKRSNNASGFHGYIGKGRRIVSVEQYGGKVRVREIKGMDIHTNHFLHPEMSTYGEIRPSSATRLQRLEELLASTQHSQILVSPDDPGSFSSKVRKKVKLEMIKRLTTNQTNPPGKPGARENLTSLGTANVVTILFDRENRPYPLYSKAGDKMRTLSTVVVEGKRVTVFPTNSRKNKLTLQK